MLNLTLFCEEKIVATEKEVRAMDVIVNTVSEFQSQGLRVGAFTSMQKTCAILSHMVQVLALQESVKFFFADTSVHFPETLEMLKFYREKFGIEIISCAPELSLNEQTEKFGRVLHEHNDEGDAPGYRVCCHERKHVPLQKGIRDHGIAAVFGGLRRAEGNLRANLGLREFDDSFGVWKIHPLRDWKDVEVEEYLETHKIPIHSLYGKGYLSIGCSTCTGPVLPGGDSRSGRWPHLNLLAEKRYCAINPGDRKS